MVVGNPVKNTKYRLPLSLPVAQGNSRVGASFGIVARRTLCLSLGFINFLSLGPACRRLSLGIKVVGVYLFCHYLLAVFFLIWFLWVNQAPKLVNIYFPVAVVFFRSAWAFFLLSHGYQVSAFPIPLRPESHAALDDTSTTQPTKPVHWLTVSLDTLSTNAVNALNPELNRCQTNKEIQIPQLVQSDR